MSVKFVMLDFVLIRVFELYHTKKDYKQAFQRNQGQNVESDDSD